MANDEHNGRKIVLGALVAGAAGYLAGILTAPKSGQETRRDIADKAGEVKSEVEEKLQAVHDDLNDLLKLAKSKTLTLGSKARLEFDEAVAKAKDSKNKVATLLKAVKAGEADNPELDKALRQARQAKRNLGKYLKA